MTEEDVRATIKALTGEQVDKELEAFNAFFNQFGLRFFDAYALSYYRALQAEAESRAQLQRYSDNEKARD
jgi:hypothetical protein